MISHRPILKIATAALTLSIAFAPWASEALAYPAGDGPDMHGGVPGGAPSAAAAGMSMWTFLIVVAVTAVVAVLSTLTVLRTSGRIVSAEPRTARRGIEVFASD